MAGQILLKLLFLFAPAAIIIADFFQYKGKLQYIDLLISVALSSPLTGWIATRLAGRSWDYGLYLPVPFLYAFAMICLIQIDGNERRVVPLYKKCFYVAITQGLGLLLVSAFPN